MSDTFVTASPHWTWFIIPYFFVGGIAGGAYFLAAVLEWFGRPEDRPVIRTGYSLAFWCAVLSGLLLTLDLGRSLRFLNMLFQSDNFPHLMFKSFSPISFGAWALLLFGACAFVSWYAEKGGTPAKLIAAVGGLLGFFVAGYTGVLLSVTNRPIWADSPWLGALFLASGASTGAAAIALLAPGRGATERSVSWLESFDTRALVVELLVLVLFLTSLGSINRVWVRVWGLLLLVGVVGLGILMPLGLHVKPASFGSGLAARPIVNAAKLVLLGGFLLRLATMLASEGIDRYRVAAGS